MRKSVLGDCLGETGNGLRGVKRLPVFHVTKSDGMDLWPGD